MGNKKGWAGAPSKLRNGIYKKPVSPQIELHELWNTCRKLIKEGISSVEQDSTIINRCVKYFSAITSWMFLVALSVQSAAEYISYIGQICCQCCCGKPKKWDIRAWAGWLRHNLALEVASQGDLRAGLAGGVTGSPGVCWGSWHLPGSHTQSGQFPKSRAGACRWAEAGLARKPSADDFLSWINSLP